MLVSLNIPSAVPSDGLPSAQAAVRAPEHSANVDLFQSMMGGRGLEGISQAMQSASTKFDSFTKQWMSFGENLDLSKPATVVRVLEQQARLSSESVGFQFALQSADNLRHAFKTLTQQQA